jgi:hypothetical protein
MYVFIFVCMYAMYVCMYVPLPRFTVHIEPLVSVLRTVAPESLARARFSTLGGETYRRSRFSTLSHMMQPLFDAAGPKRPVPVSIVIRRGRCNSKCVSMYVCMYMRTYVRRYVCLYVCMYLLPGWTSYGLCLAYGLCLGWPCCFARHVLTYDIDTQIPRYIDTYPHIYT